MDINLDVLKSKKDELLKQLKQLEQNGNAINGAIQILDHLMEMAKSEVVKVEKLVVEKVVDRIPSKIVENKNEG